MIKRLSFALFLFPILISAQQDADVEAIDQLLENWHQAAANADFDAYFGAMTEGGVFIGTDATENWDKKEFMEFSKPYFDKGKAWSFKAVERNIFLHDSGQLGWFDELLDTWMQLCRGSGVVQKVEGEWKIAHYVLSLAVPNENVDELVAMKKENDSILIQTLKSKPE